MADGKYTATTADLFDKHQWERILDVLSEIQLRVKKGESPESAINEAAKNEPWLGEYLSGFIPRTTQDLKDWAITLSIVAAACVAATNQEEIPKMPEKAAAVIEEIKNRHDSNAGHTDSHIEPISEQSRCKKTMSRMDPIQKVRDPIQDESTAQKKGKESGIKED